MIFGARRTSSLLLVGDLVAFVLALWLTLLIRYQGVPSLDLLSLFVAPFSFLFIVWLVVFYIAGLYGKRIVLFPSRVPDALLATQTTNVTFAALFFFLIPAFGIAPKTTLVIYLIVSTAAIFLWRLALYPKLIPSRAALSAALIATGEEAETLMREVNGNPRYGITFRVSWKPDALPEPAAFGEALRTQKISVVVADTAQLAGAPILPSLYEASSVERRYQFVEFEDVYEEVFDRVPLSRLSYEWLLQNVSPANTPLYALSKRAIDIVGGVLMGLVTLVLAPCIFVANRFEGTGALFIRQERIGERGKRIPAFKFRSMEKNLAASGQWTTEGENRVTNVGAVLRKTSLDEFPQFVNVLAGDLSLIGPRNDIVGLGERLAEALPYYSARYLVRPGITGWAQINQQYEQGKLSPQSIEETKTRLAYDFYYLKHRSLGLDIVIALKTLKRMFFRIGS